MGPSFVVLWILQWTFGFHKSRSRELSGSEVCICFVVPVFETEFINNSHRRTVSPYAQLCPPTWPATAVAFRVQFSPRATKSPHSYCYNYSTKLLQSWHQSVADVGLRKIVNLSNRTLLLWHVAVAGTCLPVILGSVVCKDKRSFCLHSFQIACGSHTATYPRVTEDLSPGCSDRGVKPTGRPVVCISRRG